jgi:hypothetical protein
MFKHKYQQTKSTLTGLGEAPFFKSRVAKLPSSYCRDVSKAYQRAVWPSSVRIFKSTGCDVRFRRREKTASLRAITARWRGVLPVKDTTMLNNQVVKARQERYSSEISILLDETLHQWVFGDKIVVSTSRVEMTKNNSS